MKNTRAFTLIETVIYIALLAFLMTGAVTTAYYLVQGEGSMSTKNTAGEEGNFVLRKLNWALSGVQTITAPSGWGSSLSLTRYDGTTVDVRLHAGRVEMRENGDTFAPLTTANVIVTALGFEYLPAVNGAPAGLEASTTLNGLTFSIERYIRK